MIGGNVFAGIGEKGRLQVIAHQGLSAAELQEKVLVPAGKKVEKHPFVVPHQSNDVGKFALQFDNFRNYLF